MKNGNDIVNLHIKLDSKYKDQIFLYQDSEMIRWRIDSHPVRRIFNFSYKEDDLGLLLPPGNNTNLEILEMAFLDQI
ncbi:MAG: hypothetical protein IPN18_17900 [Ignavibacteriales bacterium]|nr:hypothetical protein [Ignavibacteriales bacterium]